MNRKLSSNIKKYFTSKAWAALSDYEKRRYENVMQNYEFMKSSGIITRMPEFTMKKLKISKPKRRNTINGHPKSNRKSKAKLKHLAVSKPAVTKSRRSKKGVYSDIPITTDKETSSSKTITTTRNNPGAGRLDNRKEFARNVLNSALDALENLKDMFGSMEEFKDDKNFFDQDTNLLETDCLKGLQQKPRYLKHGFTKKFYKTDKSNKDEFLYCDICKEVHKGSCLIRGSMPMICDKTISKGNSDRAKRTLPHFLSIGVSSLHGAGLGVWTEMPLVAGMVFGPYKENVIKKKKDIKDSNTFQVRKRWQPYHYVEDADKNSSNWMRYVNSANHEEWQNVIAFQHLGKTYYRTYKPVLPYSEILVWYGDDYGTKLGIQVKETKCLQPSKDITGFHCDICNSLFSSSERLKSHLKKHPRIQNKTRFQCPECSYSTNVCSSISNHSLTHSGEKPFTCPQCPKRFSRKGNLKKHILVHTGEKEHICSTCGKMFTEKGTLIKHARVHSGERPYRCPDCGKDFTDSSNLTCHRRVHKRQRPYPCSYCEHRFTFKGALTRHISSIHTKVFPHNCSFCGKGFCVPSVLRKHVKKQHSVTDK